MEFAAGMRFMALILAASALAIGQTRLTIRHVTVVDPVRGELLPGRRIAITGDRIVAVLPELPVAGATAVSGGINAAGMFAVPGLWDMHAVSVLGDPAAYVARGVTGVRDMSAADLERTLAVYRQIEDARQVGPRLITGGPGLRASSPDEARAAFDRLFDTDADFVRFHADLDFESFIALAERSRKWRLQLVGPMPPSIRLRDVLSLRQSSIEGIEGLDRLTREEACSGFAAASSAGTWFTPLVSSQPSLRMRRKAAALAGLMRECGAPVLAGGGVWEEVEALVEESGYTPAEALRTATIEPAKYLNTADSLGEIAEGRFADLVLLDANPLEEISNLRRVAGVVLRGRYFDRTALSALRRPPTIRGWTNASTSATPKPAASSAKPPVSSAKPALPIR